MGVRFSSLRLSSIASTAGRTRGFGYPSGRVLLTARLRPRLPRVYRHAWALLGAGLVGSMESSFPTQ
jgi:hypothetical protein